VKQAHLDARPKESATMKASTKDQVAGKIHELKGTVKETVGKVTDNPKLESEGTAEKISGKIQKKVGEVEKVLGK
jgi:uncharacterized protein YjbJ (UPF0337 family)